MTLESTSLALHRVDEAPRPRRGSPSSAGRAGKARPDSHSVLTVLSAIPASVCSVLGGKYFQGTRACYFSFHSLFLVLSLASSVSACLSGSLYLSPSFQPAGEDLLSFHAGPQGQVQLLSHSLSLQGASACSTQSPPFPIAALGGCSWGQPVRLVPPFL